MRTEAVSGTTPTTTDAVRRDQEIQRAIADHLPTEPHKALTPPQVRKMLAGLGYTGRNEVSNVAARRHLLALNSEVRINRTPDGKYHGIETSRRPVPSQSAEPIRRRKDVMGPYLPTRTEDDACSIY